MKRKTLNTNVSLLRLRRTKVAFNRKRLKQVNEPDRETLNVMWLLLAPEACTRLNGDDAQQ
jgi:hypothetical protein